MNKTNPKLFTRAIRVTLTAIATISLLSACGTEDDDLTLGTSSEAMSLAGCTRLNWENVGAMREVTIKCDGGGMIKVQPKNSGYDGAPAVVTSYFPCDGGTRQQKMALDHMAAARSYIDALAYGPVNLTYILFSNHKTGKQSGIAHVRPGCR